VSESPLERALRLLALRSRTAQELDRALERAKVTLEDRQAVLARLRELRYIDDAQVATGRARTLVERGTSARLAARRLRAQGVERETAREAVEAAKEGASARELAERALARKLRGRPPRDEKERRRIFRSLVQQGHGASVVAALLGIEWEGADDDGTDDAAMD
jgi:regulatory protein